MVSRRTFLAGSASAAALVHLPRPARAQAKLGDDGLYQQPWFLESLLELADDLAAATAQGKRFAIMWELRGCPFCRDIHLINFAKPEIVEYVKARFDILQLNIIGSREVVDFDGEKLPEKRLAEKYGVRSTPAFQFFAERPDGLAARKPRNARCCGRRVISSPTTSSTCSGSSPTAPTSGKARPPICAPASLARQRLEHRAPADGAEIEPVRPP